MNNLTIIKLWPLYACVLKAILLIRFKFHDISKLSKQNYWQHEFDNFYEV